MPRRVLVAIVALLVVCFAACSNAPDSSEVELLTRGLWHGSVGSDDYLYDLNFDNGTFGGRVHKIVDGKQDVEIPVKGVSLKGTDIEIRLLAIPPYRGRVDLAEGRIVGGHPDAPPYSDLNLTRVDRAEWPAALARSQSAIDDLVPDLSRPREDGDGWVVGTPDDAGIKTGAVENLVSAILAGEAGALHSLLLVRDGKLVVEEYFHGWSADDLHRLASCTKSISSLLVGIAIDRGDIEGVEVPLLDLLPGRAAGAGPGWGALRLEHLLTMSMGLDWSEQEANRFTPPGQDRFADVIARNVEVEPGTQWRYVSRNTNLLSAILLEATGMHADVFAAEFLFSPLGITVWDWEKSKYQGHPNMSGTLLMRPRDMAKLGQLVLEKGSWQGRNVVSPDWIRESTRSHMTPTDGDGYGYLWWLFDEPAPSGVVFANGWGTQYIAVVPDFDVVLVTTGGNDFNDSQGNIFALLERYLLPGVDTAR